MQAVGFCVAFLSPVIGLLRRLHMHAQGALHLPSQRSACHNTRPRAAMRSGFFSQKLLPLSRAFAQLSCCLMPCCALSTRRTSPARWPKGHDLRSCRMTCRPSRRALPTRGRMALGRPGLDWGAFREDYFHPVIGVLERPERCGGGFRSHVADIRGLGGRVVGGGGAQLPPCPVHRHYRWWVSG